MEIIDTDYKVNKRIMFFNDSRTHVNTFDGYRCDICGDKTLATLIGRDIDYSGKIGSGYNICKIKLCPTCLESLADFIRSRINEDI